METRGFAVIQVRLEFGTPELTLIVRETRDLAFVAAQEIVLGEDFDVDGDDTVQIFDLSIPDEMRVDLLDENVLEDWREIVRERQEQGELGADYGQFGPPPKTEEEKDVNFEVPE